MQVKVYKPMNWPSEVRYLVIPANTEIDSVPLAPNMLDKYKSTEPDVRTLSEASPLAGFNYPELIAQIADGSFAHYPIKVRVTKLES